MKRGALAAAAVLAGCGDPAWDGNYQGTIVFELRCGLMPFEAPEAAPLRDGIVWLTRGASGVWVAHGHDVANVSRGPSLELQLYERPDASLGTPVERGRVVFGQVVTFSDDDDDGVWQEGEAILAVARDMVIVFVHERASDPMFAALGSADVPTSGTLEPGFHTLQVNSCPAEAATPWALSPRGICVLALADPAQPFFPYGCWGVER